MHTAQMEKFAAAEATGHESSGAPSPGNGGGSSEKAAGGSLASDAQLAALREKLAGNA
jgi:small subunit ribosomal protein S1